MNRTEYVEYIIEAFSENGYGHLIDENKAERLGELVELLLETNRTTNLTAITDKKDVVLKHLLDCATVCDLIEDGARIIDVGCGAGFPSLPIAILRSDVDVTALDSTGKKINFVNLAARELCLKNIRGVCGRAEDFVKENRDSFDLCVSRAVARLNVLDELCAPFVKIGGAFVAMKSERGAEEYAEAKKGIERLGCKLSSVTEVCLSLSGNEINRELYVFEKVKQTPHELPRNYSQIIKKPL